MKAQYDAFNTLEKIKARICACGNFQSFEHGFKSDDLNAPTASLMSVYIVLQITSNCGQFEVRI
jgi:hypothetical protein